MKIYTVDIKEVSFETYLPKLQEIINRIISENEKFPIILVYSPLFKEELRIVHRRGLEFKRKPTDFTFAFVYITKNSILIPFSIIRTNGVKTRKWMHDGLKFKGREVIPHELNPTSLSVNEIIKFYQSLMIDEDSIDTIKLKLAIAGSGV